MKLAILLLITFSASVIRETTARPYFVIWNTGQGQWLTQVTAQTCLHFDMGGEFFPLRKADLLCRDKDNALFLSHWDWDHVGGLTRLKNVSSWCLAVSPAGPTTRSRKRLTARLRPCQKRWAVDHWQPPTLAKDSNGRSHVFHWKEVLIPGDSTKKQEKQWARARFVRQSRILILGHHGSATSTSEELLAQMPSLRQAIASARWARYKHPHPRVLALLQKHRIPLLRTEDWGNIWIEN